MKRVLTIFLLIISFCFLTFSVQAKQAQKKKKTKQKIEFVTKDKFILVGDFYIPDKPSNKPLVILVHSFAMNSYAWSKLANELRNLGYYVIAMDLRGHGRSVYNEKLKYKSRYNFQENDWQKLPLDIGYSINYIKGNYLKVNTNNVIIVGADIGANAAVLSGLLTKTPPSKLVLISPMYEFKGLKMPIKTKRYLNSKIFILLSKSDKLFFNIETKEKAVVKQYQTGRQGMLLLKSCPDSINDIVKFITN